MRAPALFLLLLTAPATAWSGPLERAYLGAVLSHYSYSRQLPDTASGYGEAAAWLGDWLGFHESDFIEDGASSTAVLLFRRGGLAWAAFRGTDLGGEADGFLRDLRTNFEPGGYRAAVSSILPRVVARLRAWRPARVILTGHSLGGALAEVAGNELLRWGIRAFEVHAFGPPPAGDAGFLREAARRTSTYRWVNGTDIVFFATHPGVRPERLRPPYRALGGSSGGTLLSLPDHHSFEYVRKIWEILPPDARTAVPGPEKMAPHAASVAD